MRPRTTSIEPSVQNGHRGGRGGPSRRPIGEGGGGKVGCCVSTLVISLVVIGGAISAVSTMVVRGIPQPAMDLATRRRARKPAAARVESPEPPVAVTQDAPIPKPVAIETAAAVEVALPVEVEPPAAVVAEVPAPAAVEGPVPTVVPAALPPPAPLVEPAWTPVPPPLLEPRGEPVRETWLARIRSAVALVGVVAVLGVAAAVGVGGLVLAIILLLRQAVG